LTLAGKRLGDSSVSSSTGSSDLRIHWSRDSNNWTEDNFHRLSVQFAYQRYNVIYEGSYDLVGAAVEYFGAKGARLFDIEGQNLRDDINRLFEENF
jgi:hypothetical protein